MLSNWQLPTLKKISRRSWIFQNLIFQKGSKIHRKCCMCTWLDRKGRLANLFSHLVLWTLTISRIVFYDLSAFEQTKQSLKICCESIGFWKLKGNFIVSTVHVVLCKINSLLEYRWKTRLGIICLPKYTHCNRLSCSLFTRKPCPDAKRGQKSLWSRI